MLTMAALVSLLCLWQHIQTTECFHSSCSMFMNIGGDYIDVTVSQGVHYSEVLYYVRHHTVYTGQCQSSHTVQQLQYSARSSD